MTPTLDAAALKSFPPFAELTPEEAAEVARLLDFQTLAPGHILFRQGDPSDAIYMIVSGEVEIRLHIANHGDHLLVTFGPGAIFGEVAPLANEPRTATASARTEVNLARLGWAAMEDALEKGDRWATKFLLSTARILAQRLGALNNQLASTLARAGSQGLPSAGQSEAELGRLRDRLLRDWSF